MIKGTAVSILLNLSELELHIWRSAAHDTISKASFGLVDPYLGGHHTYAIALLVVYRVYTRGFSYVNHLGSALVR